ncbi:MBL fold metallo-hydrolase [Paenirhodobacter populi]|uniref:MBL fold metallo-hydrolase n=1 Tax=Paenirhodobacter populi TaxID=2306993 RepID=A0A443ITS4_9RHOB|nr:MBL fold metallo-hydrolase [Sinirhodobacter populi]RWR11099.1 MBL fold metallo-hydrolase [Sinirhodobacter populi]
MVGLEPGVRRIVARNPSPMTGTGTCTYVVGTGRVAVIDPGPADPAHMQALLGGLGRGERVEAIFVTHAHLDHSPGARLLAEVTGAAVHAFGPADAGRSPVMARLAAQGLAGGGEGVDAAFRPDVLLADGAVVSGPDWSLRALHTPGHFGNHLGFAFGDAIFTGDLVMGWSSTLISPPDGDLGDYMRSLDRLAAEGARRFFPGHGDPVEAPAERLAALAGHRRARSRQIMEVLARGPATVMSIVRSLYTDLPEDLHPVAARNVFAHLVEMHSKNEISQAPELSPGAIFFRR